MRDGAVRYEPIKEEDESWVREESKQAPLREQFAHECIHSRLYDTLISLGCSKSSSILVVACGAGDDAIYIKEASENITGVDISEVALKKFISRGFKGVLADIRRLPFPNNSFDYVIASSVLHHLIGQGELTEYLVEVVRVTKPGGYVMTSEPNFFHPSGILMNVFNRIKPGITGLVPYERALPPLYLRKVFIKVGLAQVRYIASSYVWNRLPLSLLKFISKHEDRIRFTLPFSLFGWFTIVWGKKVNQ